MHRLSTFTSLICLALIVGVLVLHIPLDAFRTEAAQAHASGCCPATPPATDAVACCDDLDLSVENDASAPIPKDGCDSGCHCGCCGGLPLADEDGPAQVVDLPCAPTTMRDRSGARLARPLEVFHPPRA